MNSWLVRSTADRAVLVRALAGDMCSVLGRNTLLSLVSASHPREVEMFIVVSCYRNGDKLRLYGPLGSYADLKPLTIVKYSLAFVFFEFALQVWNSEEISEAQFELCLPTLQVRARWTAKQQLFWCFVVFYVYSQKLERWFLGYIHHLTILSIKSVGKVFCFQCRHGDHFLTMS